MRRPPRAFIVSFALATSIATIAPACAAPIAQSLVSDAQIELAGGGLQRRRSTAETSWGPQLRRQNGSRPGDHRGWSADGGKASHGEKVDSGGSGSRGGWNGAYGGWNGGYGSGRGD
ncbi:MAG: hypothetical protein AB7U61_01940 [Methylocystis sp.]